MRNASREGVKKNRRGKAHEAYDLTRRLLLTVVLDGLLLTSFACSNGAKPTATITAADTADQVLIAMTHYVTNDGVVRARVRSDTAYFYQNTQSVEMRGNIHITFYDADGHETSTMSATQGTYHWATGDMEGRGGVTVVGAGDGRTLRSEVMRYKQATNQVSSDQPFDFVGPGRHITGQGFTSDPDFRNVTAVKPIGTGGHITLPNQ